MAFLGERAAFDMGRIEAQDILAFRKSEAERVSPSTVNHALKFLRMAFEQAKRDGVIVDSPTAGISTLKRAARASGGPFTPPELGRLLAVADPEWKSLLLFGFYTGQRLGDLSRLTWAHVDLQRQELSFTAAKTGRRSLLPLATPLLRHLESLPAGDKPSDPPPPSSVRERITPGPHLDGFPCIP